MTPVPSPTLFSADGLVGLIFLIMIGVTLFGGFIAATAERLVRALSGIVICFTGVAGFYYFLNSPFMAAMASSFAATLSGKSDSIFCTLACS